MIRELRITDVDRVAEIWLDTNLQAHDFIPAEYWEGNYVAVREMLPRAEVYVYKGKRGGAGVEQSGSEREEILGFIGLNGEYIEGIFVSYEAQSCGIGKALMDHVKERKQKLLLSVYKKNRRALNFYRREGFCIGEEKTDGDTGEQECLLVWEKNPKIKT